MKVTYCSARLPHCLKQLKKKNKKKQNKKNSTHPWLPLVTLAPSSRGCRLSWVPAVWRHDVRNLSCRQCLLPARSRTIGNVSCLLVTSSQIVHSISRALKMPSSRGYGRTSSQHTHGLRTLTLI